MQSLEERVAYIEGQVSEQSHSMLEVRDAVRGLEQRMDARFEAVDRRFESMERRLDTMSGRIDSVEHGLSRRLDALDEKVSRQFLWLVGVQVTTLVAIVGALVARG